MNKVELFQRLRYAQICNKDWRKMVQHFWYDTDIVDNTISLQEFIDVFQSIEKLEETA